MVRHTDVIYKVAEIDESQMCGRNKTLMQFKILGEIIGFHGDPEVKTYFAFLH